MVISFKQPRNETETYNALKPLKHRKVSDPNGLLSTLCKDAGYDLMKKLIHRFSNVWGEEETNVNWIEITAIKKGSQTACGEISLI